jgi:hypothetical protein
VFVFVFAVPALLVVVAGYAVGYGLWTAIVGDAGAEAAGWATGALALVATIGAIARWWSRRSRR